MVAQNDSAGQLNKQFMICIIHGYASAWISSEDANIIAVTVAKRFPSANPMRLGVVVHPCARAELLSPIKLQLVHGFVSDHKPRFGIEQEVPNNNARGVFIDVVGSVGSIGPTSRFDYFFGNELELGPHELTLDQFRNFTTLACVPEAITGGVYTLNADTRERLLAAHATCPSARLGVHLYTPLTTDDVAWLAALPVHVVVTETGFPTRCDPARGPQQTQYLRDQQTLLSTIPTVDLMVIYQYPVGPSCSDLDTFGLGPDALAWFLHPPSP